MRIGVSYALGTWDEVLGNLSDNHVRDESPLSAFGVMYVRSLAPSSLLGVRCDILT